MIYAKELFSCILGMDDLEMRKRKTKKRTLEMSETKKRRTR